MKALGRFILHIISNAIGILVAGYLIPGFFSGGLAELTVAAFILTVINTFLKPIVKLVSSPLILLTFGLFTIVINAIMIYILDILSSAITIQGIPELVIVTLIISIVNFVFGSPTKK